MRGLLLMVLTSSVALAGCGRAAHLLGQGATTGALDAIDENEKTNPKEPVNFRDTGADAAAGLVQGTVGALGDPRTLSQVEAALERMLAGAGRGLVQGILTGPQLDERAFTLTDDQRAGLTVLSAELGRAFARGVSEELSAQLGTEGRDGPLVGALSHAAVRTSEGLVRGAGAELTRDVPGCEGLSRRACLERSLTRLGRAGAEGAASGALRGAGVWAALLAFAAGAVSVLLLVLLTRLWRSTGPRQGNGRRVRAGVERHA